MSSVQQLQQQRKRHLQQSCLSYNDSWSRVSLVGIYKLRFLYCMIAKSACTSWVRVLLALNGSPKARRLAKRKRTYIHRRQKYYLDMTEFKNATDMHRSPYKDFYKFTFVREPLERLISAYRDRMLGVAYYVKLRRIIITKFRQHPSPR